MADDLNTVDPDQIDHGETPEIDEHPGDYGAKIEGTWDFNSPPRLESVTPHANTPGGTAAHTFNVGSGKDTDEPADDAAARSITRSIHDAQYGDGQWRPKPGEFLPDHHR